MDELQLRAIVRDVIAKRLGDAPPRPARPLLPAAHASHVLLHVTAGADHGGACLIEPATACNGCGYCQSLGH